jgi:Asp-tRNA(Asn)/Glu-tRNA(Gln) amidotransferase A subunit family amidase
MMELTVEKFHKALASGQVTCYELVKFYLERIDRYDQQGPCLNSIIRINPNVLKEAKALDEYYKKHGLKGILHGVPVLLKDNVETNDMITTAGSLSLENFQSTQNASIVESMLSEGALIIAKTNLHEFAIWGESISSILGQTLNPYDLSRTPGGSSGGTGASVAANFGLIGIGTDTINSIRSPASANNLVGIRPTKDLISKNGVVPYSNTQDVIGPITRTVEDGVRLLEAVYNKDLSTGNYTSHLSINGLKGKRIGILLDFYGDQKVHESTNHAMLAAVNILEEHVKELVSLKNIFDSAYLVKEVSVHLHELKDHLNAYLSDAMHLSIDDILTSGLHHEGIKENLENANKLSTSSPVYQSRLKLRKDVQEKLLMLFEDYQLDALVYPHQKQLVCKVGGSQLDRNGVLASVTGFPSICLPIGFSETTPQAPIGVPIGMEIVGRPFSEGTLIEIAYALEQQMAVRKTPRSVI